MYLHLSRCRCFFFFTMSTSIPFVWAKVWGNPVHERERRLPAFKCSQTKFLSVREIALHVRASFTCCSSLLCAFFEQILRLLWPIGRGAFPRKKHLYSQPPTRARPTQTTLRPPRLCSVLFPRNEKTVAKKGGDYRSSCWWWVLREALWPPTGCTEPFESRISCDDLWSFGRWRRWRRI